MTVSGPFLTDSKRNIILYGRKSIEENVQAENINAFMGLNFKYSVELYW